MNMGGHPRMSDAKDDEGDGEVEAALLANTGARLADVDLRHVRGADGDDASAAEDENTISSADNDAACKTATSCRARATN
jgi:hypothetical protein